jgi:hypothetical protein
MQVVTGLDAEFTVEDAWGNSNTVQASGYAGVKSNNAGSNLLGVEPLAQVGATVEWDPSARAGRLRT